MHAGIEVRGLTADDEYFVGTCSHRNESDEIDASARRRIAWLKEHHAEGVRAFVALGDGQHVGFLVCMPIDVSPCLYVLPHSKDRGVGTALLEAAEQEARDQGLAGVVLQAVHLEGWWFMPAAWFESRGWQEVERRGATRLLWKPFAEDAPAPSLLEPAYAFQPAPGKVVDGPEWPTSR